jgi:uncharacterized membrane protein
MAFLWIIIVILIVVSPFTFLIGLIMALSSSDDTKNRKIGSNLVIYSIITFIIGFGACISIG